MLTQLTVQQYADQLSSHKPTPGGGSAIAHIALNAVCLAQMSCNVTINKLTKKGQPVPEQLHSLLCQLSPYHQQLLYQIDEDAICFDKILCAMRLPKDNDQQKQTRTDSLQQAYIHSATSCLQLSTICSVCHTLCFTAIEYADKFVVSDAKIAQEMLCQCVKSNTHNILANTSCIVDKAKATQLEDANSKLIAQL